MLTREEAQALVERALADPELVILEEETIERPWGWAFFYQTRRYLKTGDATDMLAGNATYLVDKHTGRIIIAGTAEPVDAYIANYERSSDPFAEPPC